MVFGAAAGCGGGRGDGPPAADAEVHAAGVPQKPNAGRHRSKSAPEPIPLSPPIHRSDWPDAEALLAGMSDPRSQARLGGAAARADADCFRYGIRTSESLHQPLQAGDWIDTDAMAKTGGRNRPRRRKVILLEKPNSPLPSSGDPGKGRVRVFLTRGTLKHEWPRSTSRRASSAPAFGNGAITEAWLDRMKVVAGGYSSGSSTSCLSRRRLFVSFRTRGSAIVTK